MIKKKKIGHKSHLQSCVPMYTQLEAISLNLAIHTYQDEEEAENWCPRIAGDLVSNLCHQPEINKKHSLMPSPRPGEGWRNWKLFH